VDSGFDARCDDFERGLTPNVTLGILAEQLDLIAFSISSRHAATQSTIFVGQMMQTYSFLHASVPELKRHSGAQTMFEARIFRDLLVLAAQFRDQRKNMR
jgi:hypothetical protein